MHIVNFLHLPDQDRPLAIAPIRLDLVKRLQRLVPEVGFATTESTTENCSQILYDIVMNLNGRARDQLNQYGDVIEARNRERAVEDRRNGLGDESDESDAESWNTHESDGLPMGVERILALPLQ